MRKLLILLLILSLPLPSSAATTAGKTSGPVMLEARREHKEWEAQQKAKAEAEKSFLRRIYDQVMTKLGFATDDTVKKTYRKDLIPEIFVQDNCEDCRKLERFFDDSKMPHVRYDIQRDLKGADIYHSLGIAAMPMTRVGTTVVKGYDTKRIEVLMAP